jgi:hypothetical protein
MTRDEKNIMLEFINDVMTPATREALTEMCLASVQAFQTCTFSHPIINKIPKMKSLLGLMAVESAIKHHSLLSSRATEQIELTAHSCAEALTRTILDGYDDELSLDQNLELWKLKKI